MSLLQEFRDLLRARPAHWDACDSCEGGAASATSPLFDLHVRDKRYGGRQVLHDVRLRVPAGEIVALVGASGCGKSSLLRIAAGLDADYDGEVRLSGRAHAAPTREVGFIFQEPRLFPWCSVAANVAFDGDVAADIARVSGLLDEVGLAGYESALPKQLSGGQAQRVALARGLYGRPRVLLLDEPFSAIDAFTRMKLQDLLLSLVRRHGLAVLLVTHDIDEAAYLSDRVLVLEAGPGRLSDELELRTPRPRDRESSTLADERRRVFQALHAAHAL